MSERFLDQLSRLTITVHCEVDGEGQALVRHLQRTRARVKHMWPIPDRIGEETSIVLCAFERHLSGRLAWSPGEAKAALVLILPASGQCDLDEIRAAAPDALLYRPIQQHTVVTALQLALDHFTYGRRLHMRIARLEENIKSLREIERAKQVIMARQAVGEQEAYRLLRDMAMAKRVAVADLATKVIDSS